MPWLRNFLMALLLVVLAGAGRAQPADAARAAQAAGALVEVFQLADAERWPEALEAAKRAQAATPDDPRIGLVRLEALVALGREGEAERVLDEELWFQLGEARWRPVLQSYSPAVLTSWARRVALRRFARGAEPRDTAAAARAALEGFRDPGTPEPLGYQLAVALVAIRTGPRISDAGLSDSGHALLAARCPPAWAAGALLVAWVPILLLAALGSRARALAAMLGAALLVIEIQVLAGALAGLGVAGVWTLLLELPRRAVVYQAVRAGGALGAFGLATFLLALGLARGRPAWFQELTLGPTKEDLQAGLRWGVGVVAWLALLVVAQAAWRAASGSISFGDAFLRLVTRGDVLAAAGGVGVLLRVVVGPWLEEALFRGALFGYLRGVYDWRGAAVLSALAFAAAHGRDPLALVGAGILLAAARHRTQRLWPCVIAHAIWNAVGLLLAAVLT